MRPCGENRKNDYLTLPDEVLLEDDLGRALAASETVIVSISAQQLRGFAARLNGYPIAGKTFILCMKGLEEDSGKRLTQVMRESLTQPVGLAVWVGPGHVQDFLAGVPNCMVIDSDDRALTQRIVEQFQSELLRLYIGTDLIGTEIGAAAKNVMGIAAGLLDGKGLSSLKGGTDGAGRAGDRPPHPRHGGNELSAYGCAFGRLRGHPLQPSQPQPALWRGGGAGRRVHAAGGGGAHGAGAGAPGQAARRGAAHL